MKGFAVCGRNNAILCYGPHAESVSSSENNSTKSVPGKRHLVFAPAKYLSNKQLLEYGVDYCPLPFALYREG